MPIMVLIISLFFSIYTMIQIWDSFAPEMPVLAFSDVFNNFRSQLLCAAKFPARKKAEKSSCPGTLRGFRAQVTR